MRIYCRPVAGLALFCLSLDVLALESGITAGLSTEWTDNVYLSNIERRNDLLETLELGANLGDSDSWYDYRIDYQASHERYERDSYDANTYYNGTATLDLIPFPGRFDWSFSVLSETTLQQSVLADTPDNRDQRNIYSTSPRLVLISRARDKVAITGSASKVDFRESEESDSDRVGAGAEWDHRLSELTRFTVSADQQSVHFADVEDYDSTSYAVGINRRINGGEIEISAGQTQITPEESDKQDGLNYQATINWSNDVHTLNFQAFRDLTDSSVGLSGGFDFGGLVTPSEINTDEVELVTRTRFSLGYDYNVSRTLILGSLFYYDDEKTETGTRETEREGASLFAEKTLVDSLRVRLDINYEHSDEKVDETLDIIRRYRVSIEKDYGQYLLLTGWLGREESDSDNDFADYEQHTVGMRVDFNF